jgi:undecaprenyl phosphate N,N'-diacetylbacillosamine 1-phosphate transferase
MYKGWIKRVLDLLLSTIAIILLSPVFLLVFVILSIANKGSVFFTQLRPGKNNKIFRLVKFKTMTDEKDENGELLPDAKRLTMVGKVVRKLSLDEIPQLLNVFMGQMSLIGPRPLLTEYLSLYNEDQIRRHDIRPGITGWAQINGRNAISWEKKFNLDLYYVDNLTLWLDIKILYFTALKVVKIEGISSGTSATMEKFTGTIK